MHSCLIVYKKRMCNSQEGQKSLGPQGCAHVWPPLTINSSIYPRCFPSVCFVYNHAVIGTLLAFVHHGFFSINLVFLNLFPSKRFRLSLNLFCYGRKFGLEFQQTLMCLKILTSLKLVLGPWTLPGTCAACCTVLSSIYRFQFALAWGFSRSRLLHASSRMLTSELTVNMLNIK